MPAASIRSAGDIAIHTESLTKDWGRTRAVDSVDLDVRKGEIFGFFGPNGAGKTTTMRMLCGLTAPTGGSATVWGVDVGRDPTGVRANMTIVPEETSFYEKMTARAYLSFFAKLAGNGSESGSESVRRAAEVAEVSAFIEKRIADLSHGQRQRVILARAFLPDKSLTVLDEPFGGVDIVQRKTLRDYLRSYAAKGNTVFFTSHNLIEAEHVVDRFAFIDKGKLVTIGAARELREKYLLPSYAIRVTDTVAGAKALAGGLALTECVVKGEEILLTLKDAKDAGKIAAVLGSAGVAVLEMKSTGTMEDVFLRARDGAGRAGKGG